MRALNLVNKRREEFETQLCNHNIDTHQPEINEASKWNFAFRKESAPSFFIGSFLFDEHKILKLGPWQKLRVVTAPQEVAQLETSL